jgi:hypothetical protein
MQNLLHDLMQYLLHKVIGAPVEVVTKAMLGYTKGLPKCLCLHHAGLALDMLHT